jgi:hypothetical protein
MVAATVLGVQFVPVLYVTVERTLARIRGRSQVPAAIDSRCQARPEAAP